MAEHQDNPAGRLYLFFDKLMSSNQNAPSTTSLVSALQAGDWRAARRRLEALQVDSGEAQRRLKSLQDPSGDIALSKFRHIDAAFEQLYANTAGPLSVMTSGVDAAVVFALQSASALLDARWRDASLGQETVAQLATAVAELISTVSAATDLDGHTKAWLVKRLGDILEALASYGSTGYPPFERATDELFGGLAVRNGLIGRIANSTTARAVELVLSLLCSTISIAVAADELVAGPPQPLVILQREIEQAQPAVTPGAAVHDEATPDPEPAVGSYPAGGGTSNGSDDPGISQNSPVVDR